MNSNIGQIQHMNNLLGEAINAAEQLQFNLKVASGDIVAGNLTPGWVEDIEFDLKRLRMFSRAVEEAWGYCEY